MGESAPDGDIAAYSCDHDRLILIQDDDFFTDIDPRDTGGVLAQRDQRLSGRQVGEIVNEMATHVPQDRVVLEYVSTNWL